MVVILRRGLQALILYIREEGEKRSLTVVDIYPLSQQLKDEAYIATDGLHPSAAAYAQWEKIIYPAAY